MASPPVEGREAQPEQRDSSGEMGAKDHTELVCWRKLLPK